MYTLSRPGQTLDRAVELLWRVSPPAAPGPSTWPLGPAALATAIVVWPRSYAWGPADKWLRHLRTGLEAWVTVRTAEIPQPYSGVVIIRLAVDGTERELAVDYSDRQAVNEDCVDRVAVYFKMQYREEGYPWPHVVPGGSSRVVISSTTRSRVSVQSAFGINTTSTYTGASGCSSPLPLVARQFGCFRSSLISAMRVPRPSSAIVGISGRLQPPGSASICPVTATSASAW